MSTPYGLSAPLYIHSGQTDLHSNQYHDPYPPTRLVHSQANESQYIWDATTQSYTPGAFSSLSYQAAPGMATLNDPVTGAQYFPSDSEEDKDEFVTFGTCVSLRGERSGYDPMQSAAMVEQTVTDVDDTLLNAPLSAGLDADVRVVEEDAERMLDGVDSNYTRLVRENELLRKENLRLHELNETYEAKHYTQDEEGVVLMNGTAASLEDDEEPVEEIIEEEIHTIKHPRVAPTSTTYQTASHMQQELSEFVERQDEATQSVSPGRRSVGTGNWSTNQHHMIDLTAPIIDETQFPASYWSRLEELFYNRFGASRPVTRELGVQTRDKTHRTTATMATPLSSGPQERRCFGVSVRPAMQNVGVMCPRVSTREFGCTTVDSGAATQDWVENHLTGMNETTRNQVRRLFKSSMSSREEFLESIMQVLKRDLRHVGLQIKPEQRSQFVFTRGDQVVSTACGEDTPLDRSDVRPTESKLIDARPTMLHRSILTRHLFGVSVASETETPLMRSQGAQAVPELPDVTACSVQVGQPVHQVDQALDPIISPARQQITVGIQVGEESTETRVYTAEASEEMEHRWRSQSGLSRSQPETRAGGSAEATIVEATKTSAQHQGRTTTGSTCATAVHPVAVSAAGSKEPQTPVRVMSTEVIQRQSQSPVGETGKPSGAQLSESTVITTRSRTTSSDQQSQPHLRVLESLRQSAPYWANTSGSSESYTVSTERRMIDEMSQRHLLPSDVDLEALSRGGQEALDAILARSKDLGTTHVVREFQPEVEVIHHVDDAIDQRSPFVSDSPLFSPELRVSTTSTSTTTTAAGTSKDKAGFPIPVVHSPVPGGDTASPTQVRAIPVERLSEPTTRLAPVPTKHTTATVGSEETTSIKESVTTDAVHRQGSSSTTDGQTSVQSRQTIGERVEVETGTTKPQRVNHIPVRNHSFTMPADASTACQVLTEQYRKQITVSQSSTNTELDKLRTLWFDMSATTKLELEKLEDFMAILHGYHEHLLRDVMQSVDDNGSTSLHYAVGHGAWAVVNLILDSGYAEPDRFNLVGFTPIMIATVCNVSDAAAMATLSRLFRAGNVNLRSQTTTRQTPLMMAASNGSREVLSLLLEHGAQVNMQDTSGNTALMFALENGDLFVIGTLLDRPELDLTLRDNDGQDALSIAKSKGNAVAVAMIERVWTSGPTEYSERKTTTTTTTTTVSNIRRRDPRNVLRGLSSPRPRESGTTPKDSPRGKSRVTFI